MLSLELFILIIIVWLSQFMEIADTVFSITCKIHKEFKKPLNLNWSGI
jgi:hypothetical protein